MAGGANIKAPEKKRKHVEDPTTDDTQKDVNGHSPKSFAVSFVGRR
jgi:hypothetical protein